MIVAMFVVENYETILPYNVVNLKLLPIQKLKQYEYTMVCKFYIIIMELPQFSIKFKRILMLNFDRKFTHRGGQNISAFKRTVKLSRQFAEMGKNHG